MGLGVCTQSNPFKQSCPPLFCFSNSFRYSSGSFWSSLPRKVPHRRGDCVLHMVAGSVSSTLMLGGSFRFKQGLSYSTGGYDETDKQNDKGFNLQSNQWRRVVPAWVSNSSIQVAQMPQDTQIQISPQGHSFSGDFGIPQILEEEKKQGHTQRVIGSSADWLEEKEKIKHLRMAGFGNSKYGGTRTTGTVTQSEGLQNSHVYDNGKYFSDSCGVSYNKTGGTPLRNLYGQRYMSHDPNNLQVDKLEQKLMSEYNMKSEAHTSSMPHFINEDLTPSMSMNAKPNTNFNKTTKLPSTLSSRDSPWSNTGKKGALRSSTGKRTLVDPLGSRISPPPREPNDRLEVVNGKGHSSVSRGHALLRSISSGQKGSMNNNLSGNYANGPLSQYPEEQNCLTQTLMKNTPKSSSSKKPTRGREETNSKQINGQTKRSLSNGKEEENPEQINNNTVDIALQEDISDENVVNSSSAKLTTVDQICPRERLLKIYDKVLVVDNISMAEDIVGLLTTKYRHCVHACDTEVANIDVKQETPVAHGELICFSIYSGPEADFGDGKSCIWVDVLDGGGKDLLVKFKPFFDNPSIKKVWHNYSFDKHIIENYGIKVSGFHADTMHMARLWDSSRRIMGGYSLEALSGDPKLCSSENIIGKVSMKTLFGRRKMKKDGSEGKIVTIPPVEEIQREERKPWICYSALDSISTLELYESLKSKLSRREWKFDGHRSGSMLDFYERYWCSFGELLVEMETHGMLVDRAYLSEMEKVARAEQQAAANRFRSWASKYCPDAKCMNVGSDAQLRQLFFGGIQNGKDPNETLPLERSFKVPNVEKVIEKGKKTPGKYRNIKLHCLVPDIKTEMYTATGWPSVSGDALKALAGKVSAEFDFTDECHELQSDDVDKPETKPSGKAGTAESAYGTAYAAFGEGKEGKEACHAISALCEVCSIDSLISNFILPLQGSHISGNNGRIHCSLNINTETGRLSARRPNLQNQPALEKDRYKIRQAFIAAPGNSLIVADYGQLELRILAHLANCKSMLDAFKAGGDFHSRTAMNMYPHIREAVELKHVLLEWHPQPGVEKPPVPLLKDAFASERRKAKMLNFSIAYGKTPVGLARDWKVSVEEAEETVNLWYNDRKEVRKWQEERKKEARQKGCVHTLLGRARHFPGMKHATRSQKNHIERAAINTPVQGSAADVAMCAMLEISENLRLKELGWRLLLQVHDEVILEGPSESAEEAKAIVVECMSKPFGGKNILKVDLSVDAKCAQNWYLAK